MNTGEATPTGDADTSDATVPIRREVPASESVPNYVHRRIVVGAAALIVVAAMVSGVVAVTIGGDDGPRCHRVDCRRTRVDRIGRSRR